eukprot:gnl/MRDRNA2_/MRDRNA2_81312_c0_seq1.p1 gnl/MRDRNA2_/MRDRNA2_81312_c0~~gnl/MRDRNA2_/MRDRNA2_81312_c0_seq1.p1  ORF type:complete len:133 (+),score=6.85 gnl/MRDRNA2_/MRDRNA2_81312_c0_seq1:126-524(+)
MPATLSKDEGAAERKKQLTFKVLCVSGLLNIAAIDTTLTVRSDLLKKILGNDPTLIGQTTANWLAAGCALQMFFATSLAQFSDSFGRKPSLILSAFVCLVVRIGAFMNPSYKILALEKIVPYAVAHYAHFAM